MTPDLKLTRAYSSQRDGQRSRAKEHDPGLSAAVGYIRHELTERIQLRRAPELHFILDHSEEYAHRIEDLLRQAKNPPRE